VDKNKHQIVSSVLSVAIKMPMAVLLLLMDTHLFAEYRSTEKPLL